MEAKTVVVTGDLQTVARIEANLHIRYYLSTQSPVTTSGSVYYYQATAISEQSLLDLCFVLILRQKLALMQQSRWVTQPLLHLYCTGSVF